MNMRVLSNTIVELIAVFLMSFEFNHIECTFRFQIHTCLLPFMLTFKAL